MFGLADGNKDKRAKKRDQMTTRPNFIEKDPVLAEIKISYLKTGLVLNQDLQTSMLYAHITPKVYYKLLEDEQIGHIIQVWKKGTLNVANLDIAMAIRNGDIKSARRYAEKTDPRYKEQQNEQQDQINKMINIFLTNVQALPANERA